MLFDPAQHEAVTNEAWNATHGLWSGAAGMLWGLHRLAAAGAVDLTRTYAAAAATLNADYLRLAGGDTPAVPGLLMGEAGILLASFLVLSDSSSAHRLYHVVRSNAESETNELMLGSPGTMLAARAMLERTGDERWREACLESANRLWDEWTWHEEAGCFLWTQRLYGNVSTYVGPGHGFAGNVTSLAGLDPDGELGSLLVAGGELTWQAGLLAKGPGLCHGTAGNGFALLALYGSTGDRVWLERARSFALHALRQVESAHAELGRGRFSLWTGDLGAAIYAWQCIGGDPSFPTMDAW